jgi:hypothetical protein
VAFPRKISQEHLGPTHLGLTHLGLTHLGLTRLHRLILDGLGLRGGCSLHLHVREITFCAIVLKVGERWPTWYMNQPFVVKYENSNLRQYYRTTAGSIGSYLMGWACVVDALSILTFAI